MIDSQILALLDWADSADACRDVISVGHALWYAKEICQPPYDCLSVPQIVQLYTALTDLDDLEIEVCTLSQFDPLEVKPLYLATIKGTLYVGVGRTQVEAVLSLLMNLK